MEHPAPSSSVTCDWTYDVFISFLGEDTRSRFISFLYESLRQRGICVFDDDESIRKGTEIRPEISSAIRKSRIAIIVFSKNYAESRFCLEELAEILDSVNEEGRSTIPVFYCMNPSEVRLQIGRYEEAFSQHEKRFKDNKQQVEKWRLALRQAATLTGFHVQHMISNEQERITELITAITNEVAARINPKALYDQWRKEERIGGGAYGNVHVGINIITGESCAIKETRDIKDLGIAQSLHQEIQILSRLEHENIVKYYGSKREGGQICIYMEYVRTGSLKDYMTRTTGALQESVVQDFTAQILSGLAYLHSQRVLHRDIKPQNLLVDSGNKVKLVDFGLSKLIAESMGNHSKLGTLYYTAPEVIDQKKYVTSSEAYAADIWSLGCVVIEMFTGMHPWPDCSLGIQAAFKVCHENQDPEIPEDLCVEGKDFLRRCFTRDPAMRPSAEELLKHPFVEIPGEA